MSSDEESLLYHFFSLCVVSNNDINAMTYKVSDIQPCWAVPRRAEPRALLLFENCTLPASLPLYVLGMTPAWYHIARWVWLSRLWKLTLS